MHARGAHADCTRFAHTLQEEVERQGLPCIVAGVPKSIDNDILLVSAMHGVGMGSWGPQTCSMTSMDGPCAGCTLPVCELACGVAAPLAAIATAAGMLVRGAGRGMRGHLGPATRALRCRARGAE